jgi:1-deoxy-D-xylulose-5-phosphate reductoisomerase
MWARPIRAVGDNGPVKRIVLLGSTGSIGTQAVDVVRGAPHRFSVVALAAGGANPRLLADQALDLGVEVVAVADPAAAPAVEEALAAAAAGRPLPELRLGEQGVESVAAHDCDVVLNGMTGSVGLGPTLAALAAGRVLALANKESLIVGGALVIEAARAAGGTGPGATDRVVPVDSEHSALAQCLRGGTPEEVARLVLTASGGPFRGRSRAELAYVTPEQALAHPTWAMGPVVTTNSATMVNKALEVIEAHLLFGVDYSRIDVVVHPQSIVHSMVEFVDGSTLAQCSPPDMRLPIALGLGWPERVAGAAAGGDFSTAGSWEFIPLDAEAFPAVDLARRVGAAAGTFPAVFNAANEECVAAFLSRRVGFPAIVDTVRGVVDDWAEHPDSSQPLSLEGVLEAERWARRRAATVLGELP